MRRTARWVGLANVLGAPRVMRGRRHADAAFAAMVRDAEDAAETDAAIAPAFIDSYRLLFREVAAVETLTYIGWRGFVGDLTRRMTNRLRVERLIAEQPDITARPVVRPVFVVGLPRTATTLAHRVFTVPRANRAPLMWELMSTDRGDIDTRLRRQRIAEAQAFADFTGRAAPVWNLIHPMDALQPEECVFALPHGLQFYTRIRLPRYRTWLASRDFTEDYQHLKNVLQVLQWGLEPKRWILKSAFHLYNLGTLLDVFPDATVVWTHRDPSTVMGSWCSLVETSAALHNRTWDPAVIGADWLELLSQGVEAARAVRAEASRERFVDVPYHSLTANPHVELPKLFGRLGMEWTREDEGNLDRILAGPGMRRSHEYHLSRYGIDHDAIDRAFGNYAMLGFER
jgi:hypothetical protein